MQVGSKCWSSPARLLNLYVILILILLLLGMVTAMDEALGDIIQTLKDVGLFQNTIIAFTSDNGAIQHYGGNNYPLRGGKGSLWEGGIRVPGMFYSPFLPRWNRGTHFKGLFHATDWLPTLYKAAGGDPEIRLPRSIDGVNQLESFFSPVSSWSMSTHHKRKEFLYNIDPKKDNAAIRVGDMKLIKGYPGNPTTVPAYLVSNKDWITERFKVRGT